MCSHPTASIFRSGGNVDTIGALFVVISRPSSNVVVNASANEVATYCTLGTEVRIHMARETIASRGLSQSERYALRFAILALESMLESMLKCPAATNPHAANSRAASLNRSAASGE